MIWCLTSAAEVKWLVGFRQYSDANFILLRVNLHLKYQAGRALDHISTVMALYKYVSQIFFVYNLLSIFQGDVVGSNAERTSDAAALTSQILMAAPGRDSLRVRLLMDFDLSKYLLIEIIIPTSI